MHRICKAVPESDFRVFLEFADGAVGFVDFKPLIHQGGVYTPLKDPAFFAQVAVDQRGRHIAWPGEVDFCADALRNELRGI